VSQLTISQLADVPLSDYFHEVGQRPAAPARALKRRLPAPDFLGVWGLRLGFSRPRWALAEWRVILTGAVGRMIQINEVATSRSCGLPPDRRRFDRWSAQSRSGRSTGHDTWSVTGATTCRNGCSGAPLWPDLRTVETVSAPV